MVQNRVILTHCKRRVPPRPHSHVIMMRLALPVLALLVCATALPAQDKVDFQREVRPILSNHCFKCHGPAAQEAGLRLDDRDRATRRKVIVPGKSSESKVLARVLSTDEDERMPPPHAGDALKPAQIATLKKWSDQGADYAPHWAFVKPTRPEVP